MPKTSLLLRAPLSGTTLSSLVTRSQTIRPPYPEYNIEINTAKSATHLEITLLQKPAVQPDEGFESDVDTISIVSSDESFTSSTCLVEDHALKRENDSANGSSSSESDNEGCVAKGVDSQPGLVAKEANIVAKQSNLVAKQSLVNSTVKVTETFALSDILCYTDVKYPKILLFVIKESVLVFSFDDLTMLQYFYTSFNTLKAVTNQRTYSKTLQTRFNLLQRTDNNGMTHIEISRQPGTKLLLPETSDSSIISLNTPDIGPRTPGRLLDQKLAPKTFFDDSSLKLSSERTEYPKTCTNSYTLRPKGTIKDTHKGEPIDSSLKKVWKSAEDILDTPRRPERKRKVKGRAPPPPTASPTPSPTQPLTKHDIMKGQYIRVAVDPKKSNIIPNEIKQNFQTFSSNVQTFTPNWNNLRTPQSPLILTTVGNTKQNGRQFQPKPSEWTNSVPRLLKKRSKSETRVTTTPMAYRYIDTTTPKPHYTNQTISNRLFGLSQKLKEFSITTTKNFNFHDGGTTERRNSLGEMTYKVGSTDSANLKSVIKKTDEKKNKNAEKKVTFSAYATVQVV